MRLGPALALLLLLTDLSSSASAADGADPAAPILRIETGMHDAVINRLALADDGRELITVSDDKTTRRWSLADGGARAVWRTPIGDGDEGALYAVAASQDTVVVGGRSGGSAAALYVFDRRSGQMRGSIGGFAQAISALAFSPDGRYLAVGLQGHGGLLLIDFTQRKPAGDDRGYAGTIEWIAFAADGRLATSSADGKLRLYDEHLKLAAMTSFADSAAGDRPWGLAFSPDGARLAVGSLGAAEVRLFAGGLKLERTLDGSPSRSGALSVVAWSADGATLAAAGSYKDGERRLIRFWHARGKDIAAGRDVAVARDTVTDLALLAGERAVYVTAEPSVGIVAEDGKSDIHRDAGKADFRDAWRDAFRVSPDGAVVDLPAEPGGKRRFRFDLVEGALSPDPPPRSELKRAALEDDRLKIADWQNGTAPKLNGRAIALDQGERVHSIAVLPGGHDAALGTDFYVRLEHAADEGWRKIVPAPAWSVNASGDGRYVLAALGDGTIRWYAAADGREVMTLFVDPRDRRWVAWTPEGFFDHSRAAGGRGGETLVGYHLNNGPNKAADFVEIGQLYNLFYRRDLVLAKFRGGAAGERSVAQQLARIGDVRAVLKTGLPPRLELVEGCIRPAGIDGCPAGATKPTDPIDRRATIAGHGSELFARYRIVDRGGGLGRVILRRNGAVIDGGRKVEGADAQHRVESVALPLDPVGDEVRLASESQNAAIQSRGDDDLVIDAKPSAAPAASETTPAGASVQLFVLAIGVSQYRQPEFRLANAANDARSVAELLRKPTPPVYDTAEVATLLDDEATAPNITRALQQIAAKARPQDIVVIFLSGHGESVDGKYFFAPVDFATRHPERLAEAKGADAHREAEIIDELFRLDGIGETQLFPLLAKIQGNLLLVLDTCYSATLATRDAVEQKARNETVANSVGHEIGRFILAGARSLALDSNGDSDAAAGMTHGLFTTHLLKGLDGEADLQHNGRINVAELLMFTKTRVREESRKLNLDQEPFYYFSGSNFFEIRAVANR
ncbi:MAG TPA: caspase family protein [Stellaceae bacterium]